MNSPVSQEDARPVLMLVHEPSTIQFWMKQSLSRTFQILPVSGVKGAIECLHSTQKIDVLITDLDLSLSQLGGCNIARDVRQRFPESLIYVFTNATGNDHRMMILRSMKDVHFLSKPFGVLFLAQKIKEALKQREKV